jgi:hypothetical protein
VVVSTIADQDRGLVIDGVPVDGIASVPSVSFVYFRGWTGAGAGAVNIRPTLSRAARWTPTDPVLAIAGHVQHGYYLDESGTYRLVPDNLTHEVACAVACLPSYGVVGSPRLEALQRAYAWVTALCDAASPALRPSLREHRAGIEGLICAAISWPSSVPRG